MPGSPQRRETSILSFPIGSPARVRPCLTELPSSPDSSQGRAPRAPVGADARARERAVTCMITASVLAVIGTLTFAWALRAPDQPWLFAVGAVPWIAGIVLFALAMWRFARS